jgi:glucose/arabinose dehydrogenase
MRTKLSRVLAISGVAAVSFCAMMFAQKNSVQPQPQVDKLAAVSVPTRGNSARGVKPDDVMPTAPAGFNVSVYAELPSPRMMVYAANGDLFVSSPGSNTITVLRDANNDGVFEARSVFAEGGAPAGRGAGQGGGAGAGAGAGRGPGGPGAGRVPDLVAVPELEQVAAQVAARVADQVLVLLQWLPAR